jgi:hypothetical protein
MSRTVCKNGILVTKILLLSSLARKILTTYLMLIRSVNDDFSFHLKIFHSGRKGWSEACFAMM